MTYGFIGCGNMGGALIRAAVKAVNANQVWINDMDMDKAGALAEETGAIATDIVDLAQSCDYIFLGVKPQVMEKMLDSISDVLAERNDGFVLVSMAAGMTINKIRSFSGNYPVIRIMPNLAAAVGEGMILYTHKDVTETEVEDFLELMKYAGRLMPVEESMIDAGCALSGSGPAFAFLFIEALADGGVRCGLKREEATVLAAQTLLGAAKLLLETGKHPAQLKDAVCSPGGTTIAGVSALEEGAFRSDVIKAVLRAYERAIELR